MPRGMFLRSASSASSLADPENRLGLDRYRDAHGIPRKKPVPIEDFVSYGHWFQQQAVPDVDTRMVAEVSPNARGFHVRLEAGEEFQARRVVLATGISLFANRPSQFADLPTQLVSHTVDHADLSRFKGKKVVVLGAGQSALESAALLYEAGSAVEVVSRAQSTVWLADVKNKGFEKMLRHWLSPIARPPFDIMGPRFVSWLIAWPRMYRRAPRSLQKLLTARAVRPAGSYWLVPRLKSVAITSGCTITAATTTRGGSQLRLKLSDGSERVVDHLLLGTGYRVDVKKYGFLAPVLRDALQTRDGYPQLGVGFESSVPGLHFLGTPAADTFGPLCRFVAGTPYAARELTRYVSSRKGERPVSPAPVLSDAPAIA